MAIRKIQEGCIELSLSSWILGYGIVFVFYLCKYNFLVPRSVEAYAQN